MTLKMENINKDLLAPCGLYCGVCAIFIAHRDNNEKFKKALLPVYKMFAKSIDDIACTGCLSEGIVFPVCQSCPIKKCTNKRELEGCFECDDWPCKYITNFPIQKAKNVMMRTIPTWREMGTQKFVELEEERYRCPECGNQLFRGVRKCNKCDTTVELD
jgi:predicted RNA-binding Zn-ribbon protein involved in translation (DUF1610 family)